MKLPIVTNLTLAQLASDPREVFQLSRGAIDGLTALGITTMWKLLAYTPAELTKALTVAGKGVTDAHYYPRRTPVEVNELLGEATTMLHLGMLPAGLRDVPTDTPIEQIFVPQKRPPLTAEQVAFLRQPVSAIITDHRDGAWLARARCRTVLEVTLLIVHMRDEKVDNGTVPRLRAEIEKVVGPLPLQLMLEELDAFRQASVDYSNFEMT